jgi:NDP-sugar pyrophosphorylase family protein
MIYGLKTAKESVELMQAVILAGGLGTRLKPLTEKIPKSMIPIGGKPFLEHQLNLLKQHGISDVVLCIGYLGEKIKRHFGNGQKFGVKIEYSEETELRGTAGAIKKARGLLKDVFFVTYGDAYLILDYQKVMEYFNTFNKLGLMVVYKNFGKYGESNVVIDGDLIKIYNKKEKAPNMVYIDFGVSVLRKKALDLMPEGKVVDLEEFFQELIKRKELLAFETDQRFYEIGSPEGLAEVEELVSSRRIKL